MMDQDGTGTRKQPNLGQPMPQMMTAMPAPMMFSQGGAPYPMMVPVYMPNMGFYGQPGMMMNPFGQSQYSIPQLDGATRDSKLNISQTPADRINSWQPVPKQREPVTKEEYLERFNKEIFPKLGGKRLVKLQAVKPY